MRVRSATRLWVPLEIPATPYFFNPARRTAVEPLEEMVSEERPSRYNAYDWGEFFCTRRRSNFSKLDVDNIQIAHLRKDSVAMPARTD